MVTIQTITFCIITYLARPAREILLGPQPSIFSKAVDLETERFFIQNHYTRPKKN